MARIFSMANFPSEETRSRDYEDAMSLDSCEIWVYHFEDKHSVVLPRLKEELEMTPYINSEMKIWEEIGPTDEQCVLVYISDFTTDGFDLAYYLKGQAYVSKFNSGAYGMGTYTGPIFITPAVYHIHEEFIHGTSRTSQMENRVIKDEARTEQVRWRYLFETAKLGWGMLEFDPNGIARLETMLQDILAEQGNDSADPGTDREIAPVNSPEAGEIHAEMSEKKQGKMRAPQIEEPVSDTDQNDRKSNKSKSISKQAALVFSVLSFDSPEAEKNAIIQDLENLRYSRGNVSDYLYRIVVAKSDQIGTSELNRNLLDIVNGLSELMDLFVELDDARSASMNSDEVDFRRFVDQEAQFNSERDSYIKRMQAIFAQESTGEEKEEEHKPELGFCHAGGVQENSDALSEEQMELAMQLMQFTNQEFEDSVWQMKVNCWNLELALSGWSERMSLLSAPETGPYGSGPDCGCGLGSGSASSCEFASASGSGSGSGSASKSRGA